MGKTKRAFCGILAAFLIFSCPVRAYATGWGVAAGAAAAGSSGVVVVLAACGILLTGAAAAVLVGSWTDRDTYLLKGAAKQLGAYAQRVYDNARSGVAGVAEKYKAIEETLIACVTSSWGAAVTGVRALAADVKDFFKSAVLGFGTWLGQGQVWQIPTVPAEQTWGYSEWSTFDFYPLPSKTFLSPPVSYDPDYTLFLTDYALCEWSPATMNIRNMYYYTPALDELFGVFDAVKQVVTVYRLNPVERTYDTYKVTICSAYVNEDGTFKYKYHENSYWEGYDIFCTPAVAGDLPFPVFGTLADAENYVATGEKTNLYVSGTIPLEVEGFRQDVLDLPEESIHDTFVLPQSADVAGELIEDLAKTYASDTLDIVLDKTKDIGLEIDKPKKPEEDPDPDKKKPIWLGWIIGEVLDWLFGKTIEELLDWLLDGITDLTEDEEKPEIEPVTGIKDKFPFCVPFDLIYLVRALEADNEIPKFKIPIKINYEFVQYNETFTVDFEDWLAVVNVLRIMLDIWFLAGLIIMTRDLIRG